MTPTLETQFVRACAKERNRLAKEASADYIRLLSSFMALGAILMALAFILIGLKWHPGSSPDAVSCVSSLRQTASGPAPALGEPESAPRPYRSNAWIRP